eukprot:scpid47106/ scgid3935/ Arf-GAP domain and FG repeat-containing protein 1; HIV-1 Rev-binding protein homolog; Nucleoporin-like protein RIP
MSSAAAKKKQDEKNLQILRELVARPHNKKCFECQQRGPTYADMTTTAFLCTSCSGLLRGISPPHRVKSISMTSFTPQEMQSLQDGGNEIARQVWLAKGRIEPPDTKDEAAFKKYLSEKYEKKLWYDPHGAVARKPSSDSSSSRATESSNKSTEVKGIQRPSTTSVRQRPNQPGGQQPPTLAQTAASATSASATSAAGSTPPVQPVAAASTATGTPPVVHADKPKPAANLLDDLGGGDPFGQQPPAANNFFADFGSNNQAPAPAANQGFGDFTSSAPVPAGNAAPSGIFDSPVMQPSNPHPMAGGGGVLAPMGSTGSGFGGGSPAVNPSVSTNAPAALSGSDKYAALADITGDSGSGPSTMFGGGGGGGPASATSSGSIFSSSSTSAVPPSSVNWGGAASGPSSLSGGAGGPSSLGGGAAAPSSMGGAINWGAGGTNDSSNTSSIFGGGNPQAAGSMNGSAAGFGAMTSGNAAGAGFGGGGMSAAGGSANPFAAAPAAQPTPAVPSGGGMFGGAAAAGGGFGASGASASPAMAPANASNNVAASAGGGANPFGDIGNIGGTTKGPASGVQFKKAVEPAPAAQPQQQQQQQHQQQQQQQSTIQEQQQTQPPLQEAPRTPTTAAAVGTPSPGTVARGLAATQEEDLKLVPKMGKRRVTKKQK